MTVWKPGSLQSHKIDNLCLMLNYILLFTKPWSQLVYNELNHCDPRPSQGAFCAQKFEDIRCEFDKLQYYL
jgi:hypothetical protein